MPRFSFQFRRSDRDQKSDAKRFHLINRAIALGLASASAELDGLRKRYEEISASASFIAGNDFDEQREPEEERLLHKAEGQMKYASARIQALLRQIRTLEKMKLLGQQLSTGRDDGDSSSVK
jgi:hypothetical protein